MTLAPGNCTSVSPSVWALTIEFAVLALLVIAVDLRNTDAVDLGECIIEPGIRVDSPVFHDQIGSPVKCVGSALDRETLNTGCGAAKLCLRCRGRDLELLQSLDGG